jgi:hypothetical protein
MIRRMHNDGLTKGQSGRRPDREMDGNGIMAAAFRKAAERKLAEQGIPPTHNHPNAAQAKKSTPPSLGHFVGAAPPPVAQGKADQRVQATARGNASAGRHRGPVIKATESPKAKHAFGAGPRQAGGAKHQKAGGSVQTLKASENQHSQKKNITRDEATASREPKRPRVWLRFEGLLARMIPAFEARLREASGVLGHPSSNQEMQLAERLRQGGFSEGARNGVRAPRKVSIVLGVDFGTTSTKIVARWPYEAGDNAVAVPALDFARAEGHAYLWASRIWLSQNGEFSLFPMLRASFMGAIKTKLISTCGEGESVLDAGGGVIASADEVATAFLALQIRQAKGWLATARKPLLGDGRPRISYNLGFPAASLNKSELRARYQRCAVAAVELAASSPDITLEMVRSALIAAAINTEDSLDRLNIRLHPEIAAAVAGFANSMQRESGLYAMVDVGGGTVDCCTFNLFSEGDGVERCPVFRASVERLGVEAWEICKGDANGEQDFRFLLDSLIRGIIWDTKKRGYINSARWNTGLPVFLIGGGAFSLPHKERVMKLDDWLRNYGHERAGIFFRTLPAPENFDCAEYSGDKLQRLGVAIGLSLPADRIPEVTLPDEIPDDYRAPPREVQDRYIDKDHI